MPRASAADRAEQLNQERAALAATLRRVGADAPTLVEGWSARDLAAHVAATEEARGIPTFVGRTLVARYGLRLNDTFRPAMAVDLRRFRRHGFEWAVRRLERDSPALLIRPMVFPVSAFEIFVHHEDVLRANDIERQEPSLDLIPSIEWLLRYHRRMLSDVAVLAVLPDGREIRGGGEGPVLDIRGTATEVLLSLAGRSVGTALKVEWTGTGDQPSLRV